MRCVDCLNRYGIRPLQITGRIVQEHCSSPAPKLSKNIIGVLVSITKIFIEDSRNRVQVLSVPRLTEPSNIWFECQNMFMALLSIEGRLRDALLYSVRSWGLPLLIACRRKLENLVRIFEHTYSRRMQYCNHFHQWALQACVVQRGIAVGSSFSNSLI